MASDHVQTEADIESGRVRNADVVARESEPKTTRPDSPSRREEPNLLSVAQKLNRTLDSFPDRIDPNDWRYQPSLRSLPDQLVNCHLVPDILDQGEGARVPVSPSPRSSISCCASVDRSAWSARACCTTWRAATTSGPEKTMSARRRAAR